MKKIIAQNILITFVSKGAGFVLAIYLARLLSKEEFGFYSSINLILLYLPFLHFGLMNGAGIELPKFINQYKKRRASQFFLTFFISSTAIRLISGLLIMPALLLLSYKSGITINFNLIVFVFLFFFLSKFGENLRMYYLSNLRFHRNNFFRIFTEILPPITALSFFFFIPELEQIFKGYSVSYSIVFIWVLIFIAGLIKRNNYRLEHFKPFLKKIYRTGFPVFLIWVMDTMFKSIDRYSIMLFYDLPELANYSFANTFSSILLLVSVSIISPYGQLLFKNIALKNSIAIKNVIRKATILIIISTVLSALLILIFYPMVVEYTGKYNGTVSLLEILLPVHFIMSLAGMFVYYMNGTYNTRTLIKFQLLALAFNIILNATVILIKLEIIWFAVATLLTVIIYFTQVFIFIRKDLSNKI